MRSWSRNRHWPTGLVLALLAMMGQPFLAGLAPAVSRQTDTLAEMAALTTFCHSDDGGGGQHPAPADPHRHDLACLACTLCAMHAAPIPLLGGAPAVPSPAVRLVSLHRPGPPATAPPSQAARPAYPRGPPVLV